MKDLMDLLKNMRKIDHTQADQIIKITKTLELINGALAAINEQSAKSMLAIKALEREVYGE